MSSTLRQPASNLVTFLFCVGQRKAGFVDPHLRGQRQRFGRRPHEAFWTCLVGRIEHGLGGQPGLTRPDRNEPWPG